MNSELIYQDLLKQYEQLSEEEKRAILIYKSSFFYHINEICSINDFENKSSSEIYEQIDDKESFISQFESFKKVIMYPQNMVVKYSIFKGINLNDIISFIDSMKDVYQVLKESSQKIKLCSDLDVYRGISVKKDTVVDRVSKSNIISTSIKVDDANDFIYKKDSDYSHLFVLSLKEGTNVLVTPLSLVYDYEDSISMLRSDTSKAKLKIANRGDDGQQEIILFGDTLEFTEISNRKLDLGEKSELNIHNIETNVVLNKKY